MTSYAAELYIPTDAELARWTYSDMRSWMIVFEAYKADHNEYPHVKTIEEARASAEPTYIRHAPLTDAWGHAYRIEADGKTFRVVSAGGDGIFQPESWSTPGVTSSYDDDAVATNESKFPARHWEFK